MAMTKEGRSALARVRGVVRAGGAVLGPEGLDMWRPKGCEEYMAGAEEISAALACSASPTASSSRGAPPTAPPGPPAVGWLVRVEWAHLPVLRERMPTALDPLIEAVGGSGAPATSGSPH